VSTKTMILLRSHYRGQVPGLSALHRQNITGTIISWAGTSNISFIANIVFSSDSDYVLQFVTNTCVVV
jgi:hypothetical protein